MIHFDSGGTLIQERSELPVIPDVIEELFADFETTSGDYRLMSVNPWRHCSVIGVAVAFDRDAPIYFVPRELLITGWWRDVLQASKRWINHNIHYDAHVSANDLNCPPPPELELICTLNDSKLINSDMGFAGGYGLDNLSKVWLKDDIDKFGHAMMPWLNDSKDYGDVPIDIMAEYACVDVRTNIKLWVHITKNMYEESQYVWRKEHEVTRLLWNIEHTGILVNPTDVKKTELKALIRMFEIDAELEKILGRSINPKSNKDVHDVLCNQYGLPVLAWTEPSEKTGMSGPSFDKDALKMYAQHPLAPKDVVKLIMEYSKLSTFKSLFLEAWGELVDDKGRLHASYNQSVRTGRMSCSEPNMQQLSEMAKRLIIPPPGHGVVVADFSQIEFRFIVHYTENRACIEAYHRDPWTDFHQFVADKAHSPRGPAKTLNFMMGYGGGKKKTVYSLSINEGFVGDVKAEVERSGCREEAKASMFKMLCEQRALALYNMYHRELLPELKSNSTQAANAARRRGYVTNHYGRRRYLPETRSHIAFNAVCQSGAGDMFKERMVALSKEMPELIPVAAVHDEIVSYAPLELLERDDSFLERIVTVLNDPDRPLRVPVRCSIGWSTESWAHAKSKEREKHLL